MNLKLGNLNISLNNLLLYFALLGPALSFGSFYLFHFLAILVLISSKYSKVEKYTLKLVAIPFTLVFYCLISLIWTPDFFVGLRHVFYFSCGLFILFILVNYASSVEALEKLFHIFCLVMLANLGIGLLESFNLIRLPASPLSPYANFLGHEQFDPNELFADQIEFLYSMPTGFTGNPNNFGFIVLLSFPFIFYYLKNIYLKSFLFLTTFYLINFIESRGLLVAFFLYIFLYFLVFLFSIKNKNIILFFLSGLVFLFFSLVKLFSEKLLLIFDDILIAIEMIKYGVIVDYDSTGVRSYIYSKGFDAFLSSPFFGGGIGSMQTRLIQDNFILVKSFHFFPFELLIDIGIVFFCLILISYVYLIIAMYNIYIRNNNDFLKKIAIACFFSLIIYPFASIVPSSTVYILPFWYVLGLSLATLKVGYYEKA
ncbi:O-antigen ligase family protein [Acinetobacter lwoffii]|uniref:O-antigen ligase family protein n=1 Tax=Acinetobacter lwoffii TaxID=28090 RepID=UPI003F8D28E6